MEQNKELMLMIRQNDQRSTSSELGQFSPIFCLASQELAEDYRKIRPRDHLELALKPVEDGGKDILQPKMRKLFTFVWSLNKGTSELFQISWEKLRPEFRFGPDALTGFVFERTRHDQVGAAVMNGPMLGGITLSFLDAINNGAVPTVTSSWQVIDGIRPSIISWSSQMEKTGNFLTAKSGRSSNF